MGLEHWLGRRLSRSWRLLLPLCALGLLSTPHLLPTTPHLLPTTNPDPASLHRASLMPSPCLPEQSSCVTTLTAEPGKPPLMMNLSSPGDCRFLMEDLEYAYCGVELDAQTFVLRHITPRDTVLEIGGRYGSTTCAIAVAQNNSGRLVSVEPDPRVWTIHEINKIHHNCASTTVYGALANQDLDVIIEAASGYNTLTSGHGGAKAKGHPTVTVKHYTWDKLENITSFKFNTVIMDCEGCYHWLVRENLDKFRTVDKVIMEYDMESSDESWPKTLETIRLLQGAGLTISPDSVWGLDNIRGEETGDKTIPHIVACQYVFLRGTTG